MGILQDNFNDYITPYKYGSPILAPSGEEGAFDRFGVDNMRICWHNGKFYCFYIGFDGKGYRTALAVSEDLLHWEKKGVILDAGSGREWDNSGRAISSLLCDVDVYGKRELIKYDGKYWMFYHAYPGVGYEIGAAANGLAWTTDEDLLEWHCEPEPVFEKDIAGCWDGGGLYSTWVVPHDGKYILYYNGKEQVDWPWHEQVGMAFSDSLHNWKRYENNPVLKVTPNHWDSYFSCGQHVLFDSKENRWVMFYCGYDGHHAREGVAISYDMTHWEKCPEPIITVGESGDIDSTHAHKPCVIYHDGMLWHFYCAVRPTETEEEKQRFGSEYRCLTVARSHPF